MVITHLLQIYYCTVVKKRRQERARLAQEQAILQQQVIQQHWQQQQQQEQQGQEQFGGGFAPPYQPSAQGYDPSNYTSIYWTPPNDPSGSRPGTDLPPAYSSVYSQGSPPPYNGNGKY